MALKVVNTDYFLIIQKRYKLYDTSTIDSKKVKINITLYNLSKYSKY